MKKNLHSYIKIFRILSIISILVVAIVLLITYINSNNEQTDDKVYEDKMVNNDIHNIENWQFEIPYNYNVKEEEHYLGRYFKVYYIPRKGKYEVYVVAGDDFESAKQQILLSFDNFEDLRNVQEKNIIFYDRRNSSRKIDDFSDIKDF